MKLSFQHLFVKIEIVEVPEKLRFFVLERIAAHERMLAKRKAILQSLVSLASLAGIISIFGTVAQSLVRSGFYDYAQLLFSGDTAVFSYWKELGLSLIESLPAFGIAVLLAGFIIFIWTGIRAAQNVRTLVHNPSLA